MVLRYVQLGRINDNVDINPRCSFSNFNEWLRKSHERSWWWMHIRGWVLPNESTSEISNDEWLGKSRGRVLPNEALEWQRSKWRTAQVSGRRSGLHTTSQMPDKNGKRNWGAVAECHLLHKSKWSALPTDWSTEVSGSWSNQSDGHTQIESLQIAHTCK